MSQPKKKKNIAGVVWDLAEPLARALGLRLWDVRFEKEGSAKFLRVEIDKDGGVAIEDCENLSRALDPVLDEHDPIDEAYYLEVSSPGLERLLTRPEHFAEMTGRPVKLRRIRAENGLRDFEGILLGLAGNTVSLQTRDGVAEFDRKDLAYVRLDDWNNPL